MNTLHFLLRTLKSLSRPHPLRDWLTFLFISSALILLLLGVGAFFFLTLRSGTIIGVPSVERAPAPHISRTELQDVVDVFRARQVNYEKGNITAPDVVDISR